MPVPRRSLSQSSFFDPEVVTPECLERGTAPWLLARYRRALFPLWLFAGWRGEGRLGRDAWPAVVLMTLCVMRWNEEGMSRRAACRRARTDLQWRAALGLSCDRPRPAAPRPGPPADRRTETRLAPFAYPEPVC